MIILAILTKTYFNGIYIQLKQSNNNVFYFDSCATIRNNPYVYTNGTHLFAKNAYQSILYLHNTAPLKSYFIDVKKSEVLTHVKKDCQCILHILK